MEINETVAVLPTANIERALNFYQEKLGVGHTILSTEPLMYWVGSGPGKFLLFQRDLVEPATHTAMSFSVPDIEQAVSTLEQRGITLVMIDGQKIFDLGGSRSAWFQDPDGHHLEISQRPNLPEGKA